jgi:hypothetical protein
MRKIVRGVEDGAAERRKDDENDPGHVGPIDSHAFTIGRILRTEKIRATGARAIRPIHAGNFSGFD